MRRLRGRATLVEPFAPAPVVAELLAAAEQEAAARRHDVIDAEHVLLALLGRGDETASTLRCLGLDVARVRREIRRLAGEGPAQEDAFDAGALDAIGVDLHVVRSRVEATFGAGALERASRRRGGCGGATFGVAPQLKRALESARQAAARRGAPPAAADVAVAIAGQRDSLAGRILGAHAISPERLGEALGGSFGTFE